MVEIGMAPSGEHTPQPAIFVIEDDSEQSLLMTRWLSAEGYSVRTFGCAEDGLDALRTEVAEAVCLDVDLPGMSGVEALPLVGRIQPGTPTMMLTASRDVDTIVQAMKHGARDYLVKPLDKTRLLASLKNVVERRRLELRVLELERDVAQVGFHGLLGHSQPMRALFQQLDRIAGAEVPVLVFGESGTGKDRVARVLHEASPRASAPFVAFNAAAIPPARHLDELFGANGRLKQAEGGTLFIDRLAELEPVTQKAVLQLIEERVHPGTSEPVSVRVVAGTVEPPSELVQDGRIREELYFRLSVVELELPPLRERGEDVLLLARSFLRRHSGHRQLTFDEATLEVLTNHDWPGNVRELENAVQRAALLARGDLITVDLLPARLRPTSTPAEPASSSPVVRLRDMEKSALLEALERTNGNISQVVRELGIGRTTVYRKLKKYGIRA